MTAVRAATFALAVAGLAALSACGFHSASSPVPTTHALSVGVEPNGVGRVVSVSDVGSYENVSCDDSCTYVYLDDRSVDLEAKAIDTANYELDAWGGACSGAAGVTCTVAMSADRSVEARFRLIPPTVAAFRAVPSTIGREEPTTLSWDVTGGGDLSDGTLAISIGPDVGAVDARTGHVDVSPIRTTTYTLTASNASGTESHRTTVTVEADTAVRLAPTSTTCDGIRVGSDCEVTVSLLNTDGAYEGAQFHFASPHFDLMGATTAGETTACFIEAGSALVIVACGEAFGAGSVARLTVRRKVASESTFEVADAGVVADGALTPVRGGTLPVAPAD